MRNNLIFSLGFPMYLKSGVTELVIVIHGNNPKLYPWLVKRTGLRMMAKSLTVDWTPLVVR